MSRHTMYKWHKRIALASSVALLGWLTSGIVMVMPTLFAKVSQSGPGQGTTPQEDFRDMRVSIPEAIAALEATLGRHVHVREVRVTRFDKRLVYAMTLQDNSTHLIDSRGGETIVITQARAEQMARAAAPHAGDIISTTLMTQRDFYYRHGATFPAYKVSFTDTLRTVVYVSSTTGETKQFNLLTRLRRWITSVHEFEPVHLIIESHTVRVGFLVFFAVAGLIGVCTGLYIAWPGRPRPARVAKEPVEV